ncbi:MAG TPA: MoaD/ThiS family protein [Gemmatimonadaceae bacterium]|nr:MoaD/ThiS family protein [Gemmatimonadaceae bacterium]
MSAATVHLFASYAESFGANKVNIELPAQSRVSDVVDALRALPGSFVLPPDPKVAVNRKLAANDDPVRPSDEIAIIPPVAGG